VFENRVLRRIFGPKRDEVQETGENCIMRSFITCVLYLIVVGCYAKHLGVLSDSET
jgi:hypothetical protein